MKSKYNSLSEWRIADPSAVESARTRGILAEICEKFGWEYKRTINRKPFGYWTKERCIENARQFNKRIDWEKSKGTSYGVAKYNGWYDECVAHMKLVNKPSGYWEVKENVLNDARQYQFKEEWKKNGSGSYNSARRNGWYKECIAHMTPQKFKWNKETLLQEANKYKTTTEFSKYSNGAYQTAIKLNCYDYVIQNLIVTNVKNKWTLEECKIEASKYNRRSDWQKMHGTSYTIARKNGWLEECCTHMKNKYKK